MSPRRIVFAALTALAVLACGRPEAVTRGPAPPPAGEVWLTARQIEEGKIVTEVATLQDVDDVVRVSGRVAFDDRRLAHMYSPVSGRVTRIEAELGQRVRRGQLLAIIESPDIGTASADLGKASADLIAAEHDFQRQKDLAAAHAASQRDLEQAEDAFRKAQAELDRAKQKLKLLRAGAIDSVTQTYSMRAEIDGEVIAKNVTPGIEVQGQYGPGSAQELFTLGESDHVWVVADVYEMDVGRVKVGDPATVRLLAHPGRAFDGKVEWVAGVLDPITHTAKLRCSFANQDRALKPEMHATLQLPVDARKELALPRAAIVRLGAQTVVFRDRGAAPDGRRRFERVPVTVDEGEGSRWVPVSRGIAVGDRVVVSGALLLSGAT